MSVWTEEERQIWAPPEGLTVSEWADRYRILSPYVTSEPGPWRTERTPYLRAIMDAMGDVGTNEVTFVKSPQIGGSEATRNALGYWIDQDPAPCMVVYPSEQSAKETIDERIIPMLNDTPRLRRYLTGIKRDLKLTQVTLKSMSIYAAHAGSPQSMATRPCRYVICDEVDKYPPFSGRESDPVSLAEARTRTFGIRRKLVLISTPTTIHGLIWEAFLRSDLQLRFHYKCSCGKLDWFDWEHIFWGDGDNKVPSELADRIDLANRVEKGEIPVWLACSECGKKYTTTDKHRLLSTGEWLDHRYKIKWERQVARVAFHISSLYSPWVAWERVVSEYLRSRHTHAARMNFHNNWLGLPYEEEQVKLSGNLFQRKAERASGRGLVPDWATYIVATCDTGKRNFWFVIRAWGPGYRSKLLNYGECSSFEELEQAVLYSKFPRGRGIYERVSLVLIDSAGGRTDTDGSRTDEVYRWSRKDRRIIPIRGNANLNAQPITVRNVLYSPPGQRSPYKMLLHLFNVGYYKDVLSRRLVEFDGDSELWEEMPNLDEDYCKQMSSEHRVFENGRIVWRPISSTVPNHLWDCSVYQCAAADMLQLDIPIRVSREKRPKKIKFKHVVSRGRNGN